jgi:hypothetical protein
MEIYLIGTHQEMQEISSRFSKEAGSEEIFIPDYECERPHFSDIRQQTMDEDMDDDDEYSPTVTHRTKKATQSMTTTGKKQTITTTDSLSLSLTSGEHLFFFSKNIVFQFTFRV